ncbi:hypothetical protein DFP72DRAFT_1181420, partial [Ephemerocybe angulata]
FFPYPPLLPSLSLVARCSLSTTTITGHDAPSHTQQRLNALDSQAQFLPEIAFRAPASPRRQLLNRPSSDVTNTGRLHSQSSTPYSGFRWRTPEAEYVYIRACDYELNFSPP